MISDFPVMVDACVLVQAAVRDTLLRLFERRLFLARWTDEIIEETVRTLRDKLGRTQEQTDYLVNELRNHFPDAWVEQGYRELIPSMTNQEKDRHVLAAAVKTPCEVIVTYNLKHFPEECLNQFEITAKHPDEFLIASTTSMARWWSTNFISRDRRCEPLAQSVKYWPLSKYANVRSLPS